MRHPVPVHAVREIGSANGTAQRWLEQANSVDYQQPNNVDNTTAREGAFPLNGYVMQEQGLTYAAMIICGSLSLYR